MFKFTARSADMMPFPSLPVGLYVVLSILFQTVYIVYRPGKQTRTVIAGVGGIEGFGIEMMTSATQNWAIKDSNRHG